MWMIRSRLELSVMIRVLPDSPRHKEVSPRAIYYTMKVVYPDLGMSRTKWQKKAA